MNEPTNSAEWIVKKDAWDGCEGRTNYIMVGKDRIAGVGYLPQAEAIVERHNAELKDEKRGREEARLQFMDDLRVLKEYADKRDAEARADGERLRAIHELVNVHFSTEHGDGEPVLTKIATIARAAIDKSRKEEGNERTN